MCVNDTNQLIINILTASLFCYFTLILSLSLLFQQ